MRSIYGFLLVMWILILLGGGIAVAVLGPLTVSGFGEADRAASSVLKGGAAVALVAAWVVVLNVLKGRIFRRRLGPGG